MSVLGRKAILDRLDELFPVGAKPENVKAAKYYLTLGKSYLIMPNGKRFRDRDRSRRIIVRPGQTAFLSTAEHIVMPDDLVGIIGPRFNSAELGILFFGGMLVDPGWGKNARQGQPLSFNIANVGRFPLELRPGQDAIASVAFLDLRDPQPESPVDATTDRPIELREELLSEKKKRPIAALGLVEDLGQIREQVDRMQASLKTVVLFGVVVVAATLFAAIIAAILTISDQSNSDQISSESWEAIGRALGITVGGSLVVVAFFYLFAALLGKAFGRARRRHPGA